MKQLLALTIFLFAYCGTLLAAEPAPADEAAPQTGPGPELQTEETEESASVVQPGTDSSEQDEDFVPSIQISEDLPVAFPIDI